LKLICIHIYMYVQMLFV